MTMRPAADISERGRAMLKIAEEMDALDAELASLFVQKAAIESRMAEARARKAVLAAIAPVVQSYKEVMVYG